MRPGGIPPPTDSGSRRKRVTSQPAPAALRPLRSPGLRPLFAARAPAGSRVVGRVPASRKENKSTAPVAIAPSDFSPPIAQRQA